MISIGKQICINILGIIVFSFYCSYSYAEKKCMFLKDVVTSNSKTKSGSYTPLDNNYHYVNYGGIISPKLFIDNQSGLTIESKDIESCSVQDVLFHPEKLLVYQVAFKLNDNLSESLQKYFQNRMNEGIALILGNDAVFTVVDIKEQLDTEFTVTVFGRTKSQIERELKKICSKTYVD